MRVIWIDPGETVGWATAEALPGDTVGDLVRPPVIDVLDYGNTKLKTFALALLGGAAKYDLIGFETYRVRGDAVGLKANVGSTVPTLQLVGMIRLAVWNARGRRGDGLPHLTERSPQQKFSGMGAAKLHASPDMQAVIAEALDGRHDDGHYGDALLHLMGWYHDRFHATHEGRY